MKQRFHYRYSQLEGSLCKIEGDNVIAERLIFITKKEIR